MGKTQTPRLFCWQCLFNHCGSYFQQDHAKTPKRLHWLMNWFLEQLIQYTQSPPLSPHRYQCDRAHLWDARNQQLSFRIGAESITNDSRSTLNLCHRKLKTSTLWFKLNPHHRPPPPPPSRLGRDLNLVHSCRQSCSFLIWLTYFKAGHVFLIQDKLYEVIIGLSRSAMPTLTIQQSRAARLWQK